jgi:hypothetical protein
MASSGVLFQIGRPANVGGRPGWVSSHRPRGRPAGVPRPRGPHEDGPNDATDALITVELLAGMIAGVLGDTISLDTPLYVHFSLFPRRYVKAGGAESLPDKRHPAGRSGPRGLRRRDARSTVL